MSTKINTDYYGESNTWITLYADLKRSPKTIYTLANSGTYEGGAFDYSASPWGIGKSSASSYFTMVFTRGENWQYNTIERQKTNTPLFLYYATEAALAGAYSGQLTGADNNMWNYDLTCFKTRISPNINADNSELKSTLSADEGTNVNFSGLKGLSPITQCIYQRTKAFIDHVYYKPVGANTINRCSFTDIINNNVSVDKIIYFDIALWSDDIYSVLPTIGANEIEVCDAFKTVYYDDVDKIVNPARQILCWGYWHNRSSFPSSYEFYYNSSDTATPQTSFETLGTNPVIYNNGFAGYSTMSSYEQEFDDVSYHWEYGVTYFNYLNQFDIAKIENGSAYTSNPIQSFAYLELDDYDENLTKNQAYVRAILHEVAFLGFPVIASVNDRYKSIGHSDVYLPVFDEEHWITTGEFINGSDSLSLPNATWQDIFSDSMPEYDPTYDPDVPPEPPEPPTDTDYGDTSNQGSARGLFPAGVNIYLMSRSDYNIFMGELNGYYQGSSPDDWTLDFQGVNPSDYILSAYYTPYNFLKSENKSAVKIGPLTLTTTAYELSQGSPGVDDPNKWKTFTYGTRTVTPKFNDFRDYEPYTTVELYLPLAGTVQLETAYVMNHDITVTYYFDLMSMSGVACIYRDSMLYKTSDYQLGCQVPLLSQNMGTIQNQIMSLDTARKQNNIRLTAATTATTGSAIKALSGKASDVSNLAGGAGLMQIASGVINADKIEYDMTHTPASVSVTGAAEPMNNYSVGQLTPKLIIKRPLMLPNKNDEIYAHTVGNACLINTTVGEMSGLIVCSNADLSGIAATSTELSAIQSALTTGIYV